MRDRKFVESVPRLSPRVAAFDCDGTLWSGDAGQHFFYWEIGEGLIGQDVAARALANYDHYLSGTISEEEICGEMVTMHEGMSDSDLTMIGRDFFRRFVAHRIYSEMAELLDGLQARQAEVWLASSTNRWVIDAAAEWFGVPRERVIAASAAVEDDRVTSRLLQVPTGDSKATCLREAAQTRPDVAFGNSEHDAALLSCARSAYAVNPDSVLLRLANSRGWRTHFPARK